MTQKTPATGNGPHAAPADLPADALILTRENAPSIAYNRLVPRDPATAAPGVVFIHGLLSDRNGTKALALERHCADRGLGFLRFDCAGHGDSDGRFTDFTVGDWLADTLAVLDGLTEGPQILIGSSMGGWLMLLAARARPERIAGLIGIAAAPDFTEDLMWQRMSSVERDRLETDGIVYLPSAYDPAGYPVTRALIEDGRRNRVLDRPHGYAGPVRLLHGMQDESVPYETALRIAGTLSSADVEIHLVKSGDHRMSDPRDLARLCATLNRLVADIAP